MEVKALAGITNICRPYLVPTRNVVLFGNGSIVQCICLSTGNLLGSYEGHGDLVTSIGQDEHFQSAQLGSNDHVQVIISTALDGSIHCWNLSTFVAYESHKVKHPVFQVKFLPKSHLSDVPSKAVNDKPEIIALVTTAHTKENEHSDKVKVVFEVNSFDAHTFAATADIDPIHVSSPVMQYISVAVQNKKGDSLASQTVTALLYTKGKRLQIRVFTPAAKAHKSITIDLAREATCITCTALGAGIVAIGLEYGEIMLIHNFGEFVRHYASDHQLKESILTKTILHWHAQAALSLVFSCDGKYLYSGGEESVLVAWNVAKQSKSFLPRLGAPLCHIVVSSDVSKAAKVLATTLDNCIRFVNTVNMEVEWFWQSVYISQNKAQLSAIAAASSSSSAFRVALLKTLLPFQLSDVQAEKTWTASTVVDPRSGHVMLNGHPGQLQHFDLLSTVVRKQLPVTHFQRVSAAPTTGHMSKVYVPSITQYATDGSGQYLVTVDVRKGAELESKDISLKFWHFDATSDSYQLSAQMDNPHGDSLISKLSIGSMKAEGPDAHVKDSMILVATASADGTVKVWHGSYVYNDTQADNVLHNTKKTNNTTTTTTTASSSSSGKYVLRWKCAYSFCYRSSPVTGLCWSQDGSMLVLAHDNLISFWDPMTVSMKHSMTSYAAKSIVNMSIIEPRADSHMGGGCGDAYLVVVTTNTVTVYSLLSMQLLWTYFVPSVTACSVARDERFVASVGSSTNVGEEGWIALAIDHLQTTVAEGETTDEEKSSKKKSKKADKKKVEKSRYEVLFFSPVQAKPVHQQAVSSQVTSLDFLHHAASAQRGIVAITVDSNLFSVVLQRDETARSSKPAPPVAMVKKATLPVLTTTFQNPDQSILEILQVTKSTDATEHGQQSSATMSRALAGSQWFHAFLPDHTEDLPRPSDIARDFLRSISMSAPSSSSSAKSTKQKVHVPSADNGDAAVPNGAEVSRNNALLDVDTTAAIIERRFAQFFNKTTATAASTSHNNNTATATTPAGKSKKNKTVQPVVEEEKAVIEEVVVAPVVIAEAPKSAKKAKKAAVELDIIVPAIVSANKGGDISEDEQSTSSNTRATRGRKRKTDEDSVASEVSVTTDDESVASNSAKSTRGRKKKVDIETIPEDVEEDKAEIVVEKRSTRSRK